MLKHVKGNLLDLADNGQFDVIVHGANCFCRMGSGIAKEIRERYPEAWQEDYNTEMGDMRKLGGWTSAHLKHKNFTIINAYTQYNTSKNGEDVFEYASFEVILKKLAYLYPSSRFGFPFIGSGLAGGNKETILKMLEEFAKTITDSNGSVTLVFYEP